MTTTPRVLGRQGDILIIPVDTLPAGAREIERAADRDGGRIVLAYGEATGHAHAICEPVERAKLFEGPAVNGAAPTRYVEITGEGVALTHEEHGPVAMPPGVWEVRRQSEWDSIAGASRMVAD